MYKVTKEMDFWGNKLRFYLVKTCLWYFGHSLDGTCILILKFTINFNNWKFKIFKRYIKKFSIKIDLYIFLKSKMDKVNLDLQSIYLVMVKSWDMRYVNVEHGLSQRHTYTNVEHIYTEKEFSYFPFPRIATNFHVYNKLLFAL